MADHASISTKYDLQKTITIVWENWLTECRSAIANEDGWTGLVIDPLLRAAGWQRLERTQFSVGSGAAFEWPWNRGSDVALLASGNPVGFMELRCRPEGRGGAKECLVKKLQEIRSLRESRWAVGSWFGGKGGLAMYEVCDGKLGKQLRLATLESVREAAEILTAISPAAFPRSPEAANGPLLPVWSHSVLRQMFFTELRTQLLGIGVGPISELKPQRGFNNPSMPTMSYAYVELRGVAPSGLGVAFNINSTLATMSCMFYRDCTRACCRTANVSIAHGVSWAAMAEFITQEVLPVLVRRYAPCD